MVSAVLAACSSGGHYATVDPGHPAYVIPHHVAEGKGEGTDAPLDEDGGAREPLPPPPPAPTAPQLAGSAPDPMPLSMAEQWRFQLLFQNGAPSVEHVDKQILPKPVSTPRRMGRFALELWIGRELIDRVRFDFPLIAAEETPGVTRRPLHDSPSLVPHAISRIIVSLPASPRATRLVLVDRATEKIQELPWPPDREASAPTPSASAPSVPLPPAPAPPASASASTRPAQSPPKTPTAK
ncbi:MAG TPA: hypothetical protein VER12_18645 [Polyangiaceae bacterium]|nr:hypothetical protein [Polyangiaceae bacterium]